jgi:integrase
MENSEEKPVRQAEKLYRDAEKRVSESTPENTKRNYRAGWRFFCRFCEDVGEQPFPASPQTVVSFIEWMAQEGYAPNTIENRLAAITRCHREDDRPTPCQASSVQQTMAAIKRGGDKPDRKEPLLIHHLRAMDFDTESLSDLRDRAILYVGFAGGFRRSVLSELRMEDFREVEGGIVIEIPKTKTDQAEGRIVQIPNQVPALAPSPNEALSRWLTAAGIGSGPLFRMVDRWGNVRDGSISGYSIYNIVCEWVESIGENPAEYGAHSLRAGFATQAYIDGVGEHEAAQQTGHSSLETLRKYQRVNVVMGDHPLTKMGKE